MARYAFAARPRWWPFHLAMLALAVTCLFLARWQWNRHDARVTENAAVAARGAEPTVTLDTLLAPGDPLVGPDDDIVWRRVQASGTWDAAAEVLVRSRSYQGRPGYYVLTPLVTGTGTAVVVNRGWIPLDVPPERPVAGVAPPAGPATVEGVLQPTQEREGIGPADPATGTLTELVRADLGRLAAQLPYPVYPAVLQLEAQAPPQPGPLPAVVPLPEPSAGPHLGYTVQWLIFSGCVVVGWVIALRLSASKRERAAAQAAHDAETGSPGTPGGDDGPPGPGGGEPDPAPLVPSGSPGS